MLHKHQSGERTQTAVRGPELVMQLQKVIGFSWTSVHAYTCLQTELHTPQRGKYHDSKLPLCGGKMEEVVSEC